MAEEGGRVDWDPEEAAGRRRRGMIIAAVIAAVGIPLTMVQWWSTRQVEDRSATVESELRASAAAIEDVAALAGADVVSSWGGSASPLHAALGHRDQFRGAMHLDDGLSLAYEVTYWLEARCVHLLLTSDDVRTEVSESRRCTPRTFG